MILKKYEELFKSISNEDIGIIMKELIFGDGKSLNGLNKIYFDLFKNSYQPIETKKINQFSLDGNFINSYVSMKEIERQLGIKQQNISKCCHGEIKKIGGYIFKFA